MARRKHSPGSFYESFSAGDRDSSRNISRRSGLHEPARHQELDRSGFFERLLARRGARPEHDIVRLIESGRRVVVTNEMKRADGRGGRNTE
jgi:hypothetical protein